jgi:hypothetical protein
MSQITLGNDVLVDVAMVHFRGESSGAPDYPTGRVNVVDC